MSSVPSTATSIAPTRDTTRTTAPSCKPRAARSSGCICSACRGLPFTNRGALCIHELLLRTWRRPISRRSAEALSESLVEALAIATPSTRTSSSIRNAGAHSMAPLVVSSRRSSEGASGPRSSPCGAAAKASIVSLSGPRASAMPIISFGGGKGCHGLPTAAAKAAPSPLKISQSPRSSSARSRMGMLSFATRRTAKPLNTMS